MPLRIKCPTGHTLIVPDDRAGRTLKCPRCDQSVVVPAGEDDTAGSALLSVLAEGIPAANLAAGSLRVAPIESRTGAGTLRTVEALAPSQPPKPPRPKAPATQTPVVKPKSRVLPAQAPRPEPMHPEPVQPAPVEPKPEPPKPELTKVAPPSAPPIEAPLPQALPAEHAVVEPAAPPPPAIQAPAPPPVSDPEPPAAEPPATIALFAAAEVPQPTVEILAAPPPWPSIAPDDFPEPDIAPPIAAEPLIAAEPPIVAEPTAPPTFVPRVQAPLTVNLNADAARTLAVYQLAVALAAAALFSVVPAVWDVVEYLQFAESPFVARWALGLFFLGVVQLAYAVYLFQLPDWTTVWVVTLLSLMLAAIYAAVLGLVLLTPADGFLVGSHGLQLADKLAGGKAALWCLCMVSLWTILAFFAGRQSTSWHKAEMMLRTVAL